MFDLTVISPQRVFFDDAVSKLWLDGDETEYEILSIHAHLMGVLRKGRIVINGNKAIPIRKGIIQFYENRCLILIEEIGPDD